MRRAVLLLIVIVTLTAFAACGTTKEEFRPAGSGAVDADTTGISHGTAANEALVESVSLGCCLYGISDGYTLTEKAHRQIVQDAVADYTVKSAAWEGVDISTLDVYIHITQIYQDGTSSEYYVYDKDGAHCMQDGHTGMYSVISDEVYRPLYELAMGWHTPLTMTVVSGGESIRAVRHWIWTDGSDGICADGFRMTPQQAAPLVEYITYAEDFAPYVDGELQPGAVFKLYNEDFEKVECFVPSGQSAWTYIGHAGPGKYIAVAEMSFEEEGGDCTGYQYFFGLVIPEEST